MIARIVRFVVLALAISVVRVDARDVLARCYLDSRWHLESRADWHAHDVRRLADSRRIITSDAELAELRTILRLNRFQPRIPQQDDFCFVADIRHADGTVESYYAGRFYVMTSDYRRGLRIDRTAFRRDIDRFMSMARQTSNKSLEPTAGRSVTSLQMQAVPPRDGAYDFDFLNGNWKAHVRRLPDRLVGSTTWIEYDGISNHKKLLDSNANFEEFEVDNPEKHLHIKGQTLRLYNPDSHQWGIYLLDLDKGTLNLPAVVGQFSGNRGEFYDQEQYKGRSILVRYVWLNISAGIDL